MHYKITIRHSSISKARVIDFHGSGTAARRAATKEFRDEHRDYEILLLDWSRGGEVVAAKKVGAKRWSKRYA